MSGSMSASVTTFDDECGDLQRRVHDGIELLRAALAGHDPAPTRPDVQTTPAPLRLDAIAVHERSLWLANAVVLLRGYLKERQLTIPEKLIVTVGNPEATKVIGQCFAKSPATNNLTKIVISHQLQDGVAVAACLVHEFIHAVDQENSGHNGWFGSWARHLGLAGEPHATYAGPRLKRDLGSLLRRLGPYPPSNNGFIINDKGQVIV